MLQAHYNAPGRVALMGELAEVIGQSRKYVVVPNRAYGFLAKEILAYWAEQGIWSEKDILASLINRGILNDDADELRPRLAILMKAFQRPEGKWLLFLSDEFAGALKESGLVKDGKGPRISLEKSDPMDPTSYEEGSVKYRSVMQYERSAEARRACISKKGNSCAVCGLSFGERFGTRFEALIIVHHLHPMSMKENRKTDPEIDLAPLCPNCHAMAHYGLPANKPRSIVDLKKIINSSKK